jgi:anaerobic dimethyl sulfoxide reductase subunit C (anchor subunit)
MNVREWALISFTILAQMAVGSFIVLGFVYYFASRKGGQEQADNLSDRALLAIGPVMVLGLIASLLHLGNPLNSFKAVTNIGSSWLSREILFGVLFTIFGAAFAFMQWRKVSTMMVRNILAWIAAALGLILVYSMSNVYMLETQPSWNTWATPVFFFTTTLLLGSLAMGVAFVANYAYLQRNDPDCAEVQCDLVRGTFRWIAIAAVVLLGVELVTIPLYLGYLTTGPSQAAASAQLMVGEFGVVFAFRLILAFIGAGVFGVFLYQNALSPGRENVLANFAYAAFVLVLIAEVLGRFLFYATQIQVMI